ncbi:MAG: AraC family transcriptional regulator [Kiritimatiellae bacterium]|nr:AraC family transcriptional regulator [Kiritimatiellia bacterium]
MDIILKRVFYYKAPHHKRITPVKIPVKHEYIELLTDGEVYFGEGAGRAAHGCGHMFWHIPGDFSVYDNNPEFPYQCLALLFKTGNTGQRHTARCSYWSDNYEVRKFAFTILRAFLGKTVPHKLLGIYAYSRLRWEALSSHETETDNRLPPALNKALEYIRNNYHAAISVAEVAEYSGVSEAHLFLLFKKHLANSPHAYLNAFRLTESKQLLVKGSGNIKEISYQCGFENVESFYRFFKKHTGQTPGQYKKKASTINF